MCFINVCVRNSWFLDSLQIFGRLLLLNVWDWYFPMEQYLVNFICSIEIHLSFLCLLRLSGKLYFFYKIIHFIYVFKFTCIKECKIISQLNFVCCVSSIAASLLLFFSICALFPCHLFFLIKLLDPWSVFPFFLQTRIGIIDLFFLFFLLSTPPFFYLYLYYLFTHTFFGLICCSFPSFWIRNLKFLLYTFTFMDRGVQVDEFSSDLNLPHRF